MVRYPYTLSAAIDADSQPDENGNYSPVESVFVTVSVCRDEVNGVGQQVMLTDGSVQVYASVIHLPLSCPDLETGRLITVTDGERERVSGRVLRFSRGQLHCRAWV